MAKMGRRKKHCEQYFNARARIKNAERRMERQVKNLSKEKKEAYIKAHPIGRKKEKK